MTGQGLTNPNAYPWRSSSYDPTRNVCFVADASRTGCEQSTLPEFCQRSTGRTAQCDRMLSLGWVLSRRTSEQSGSAANHGGNESPRKPGPVHCSHGTGRSGGSSGALGEGAPLRNDDQAVDYVTHSGRLPGGVDGLVHGVPGAGRPI